MRHYTFRHFSHRHLYYILLLVCGFGLMPSALYGQDDAVVEASLDSTAILIGEQVHLSTRVACPKGAKVKFPEFRNGYITEGVEMLEAGHIDTLLTNDGRRWELTRSYTLTAFDSAVYVIPQVEVEVNGRKFLSKNEIGLKVNTVEVDLQHPDDFRPLKAPVDNVFIWSPRLLWLCLLMWLLLLASVVCVVRLSIAKPATKRIKVNPPVPPRKVAIEAIERLKASEKEGEHQKAYYMALTDVLRTYINERFGFNARELTTHEIIGRLQQTGDTAGIDELNSILTTADLVKFAKYETTLAESDRSLLQAVEYIHTTHRPEMETAEPKEKVVVLADAGQRRYRMALKAAAILSLAGGLGLMGYLCYAVWMNFC